MKQNTRFIKRSTPITREKARWLKAQNLLHARARIAALKEELAEAIGNLSEAKATPLRMETMEYVAVEPGHPDYANADFNIAYVGFALDSVG